MKFKKEILTGLKWTFSNNVIQTFLLGFQYLILARFLEPEDFGVMAVLVIIMGIAAIFVEMGIGDAIVQDQDINSEKISQLLFTSFGLGLIAVVVVNCGGYILFNILDMKIYSQPLFLLSLTFFLTPLFYVYSAVLEKALLFADLNKVILVSFVLSFLVIVGLAIYGAGFYALVAGFISLELCKAIGSWLLGRPHLKISYTGLSKGIVPQLRYGTFISGSRLFNYLNSNVDKLLISKFLGEQALGFYSLAWNINAIPLRKINAAVNSISFPIFSKVKDDQQETNKVFDAVISFVVLLNIPMYLLLFFSGSDIVTLLLGEKWFTMGQILEWLSLLGIVKVFSNPAGPLILAEGKSMVEMYWNLFWLLVVVVVSYTVLTSNHDIVSITKFLALAGIAVTPIWYFIVSKNTSLSFGVLFGLLSIVIIYLLLMWFVNAQFNSLYLNIICALLCGISIWYYGERKGFKFRSMLSRHE